MWILPTFNRAERCQIALDSMIQCRIDSTGVVVVNGPRQIDQYRRLRLPNNWTIIELPDNVGVCEAWNTVFGMFPNEDWYGTPCDDEIAKTVGFDKRLIEAAGEFGIAHANDGFRSDSRIHSYVVYGGDLIRSLGWISLPGLWHWYHDDVTELIAGEFGLRRYCRDVMCEHRHVENGQSDDLTYQTGRSKQNQDRRQFEQWRNEQWPTMRESVCQRIRANV